MVNQLIDIISRETLLFEEFLELLERQKQMLVTNNADGLKEITELQRRKLHESYRLNRSREELVLRIKESNEIEGDVTVTRLLEFVDENQAARLMQLRETILGLNDKIAETRNTNAMLLNQSRDFISRTMTMLSTLNNPDTTYRAGAKPSDAHATMLVDRRA
jgi:predicted transcriptional regulator